MKLIPYENIEIKTQKSYSEIINNLKQLTKSKNDTKTLDPKFHGEIYKNFFKIDPITDIRNFIWPLFIGKILTHKDIYIIKIKIKPDLSSIFFLIILLFIVFIVYPFLFYYIPETRLYLLFFTTVTLAFLLISIKIFWYIVQKSKDFIINTLR